MNIYILDKALRLITLNIYFMLLYIYALIYLSHSVSKVVILLLLVFSPN